LEQGRLTLSGIGQVREHVNKLDVLMSIRPGRLHPWVLRELADVIVRPLSIVFKWSRRERFLTTGRLSSIRERTTGKLQASQLHLSVWEPDRRNTRDKRMTGSS